jgi:protoheme IX farnesyltransferase
MSTYQDTPGRISIAVVIFANLFMIARSLRLYQTMEVKAARAVMFGSYLYLPLILFALLLSKTVQA